ncbi:hypothetical protein CC85DRAFT_325170 [Cutaneotrichosporon oleaginosum]|uniref:Uncharacterized protein n=1 Tax=Cutaneotrichosporon oleaginosum TaxID=879819 RepID=A0A0J0XXX8_9TREE|nr:uncharacterized protein CC85DRAFT_325170 [Cutaneotrichosporon oleaginosum]KLT45897.1 hypothetical protein CC85DRAFT_325170 [Cutaneotrichosporon oleaginosum]TXT06597.1 hypothetical protein COLE_05928 [Cutaneotrichosporon oleaginosum]
MYAVGEHRPRPLPRLCADPQVLFPPHLPPCRPLLPLRSKHDGACRRRRRSPQPRACFASTDHSQPRGLGRRICRCFGSLRPRVMACRRLDSRLARTAHALPRRPRADCRPPRCPALPPARGARSCVRAQRLRAQACRLAMAAGCVRARPPPRPPGVGVLPRRGNGEFAPRVGVSPKGTTSPLVSYTPTANRARHHSTCSRCETHPASRLWQDVPVARHLPRGAHPFHLTLSSPSHFNVSHAMRHHTLTHRTLQASITHLGTIGSFE